MRIHVAVLALSVCAAAFGQHLAKAQPVSGPINHVQISLTGQVGAASQYTTLYENLTNFSGYMFDADAVPVLAADDLHMQSAGRVGAFAFGYYDPVGYGDALVRFWTNDPQDSSASLLNAFVLSGLPAGLNAVAVTCPEFDAPKDIWMGVTWGPGAQAAILLADPATEGYSHNLFMDMYTGGQYWFGGYPAANFALGVYAVPEPGATAAIAAGTMWLVGFRRRR